MKKLILIAVLVGMAASQTTAALITFTFKGSGSGTLGGNPFPDQQFEVVLQSDTAFNAFGLGVASTPVSDATIIFSSLGSVKITDSLVVFNNQTVEQPGFYDNTLSGLNLLQASFPGVGLNVYDLGTSFGPIISSPGTVYFNSFQNVGTDSGNLAFSSMGSTLTFQAVTAVPEPSTCFAGLTAVGMLGLFGWRNRK